MVRKTIPSQLQKKLRAYKCTHPSVKCYVALVTPLQKKFLATPLLISSNSLEND